MPTSFLSSEMVTKGVFTGSGRYVLSRSRNGIVDSLSGRNPWPTGKGKRSNWALRSE